MHRIMKNFANFMAIVGGVVLTALIVLVCISVAGRSLNGLLHGPIEAIAPGLSGALLDLGVGPVNGDFELVEAGVAFAIFSFLPLCQVTASHASVDIFTKALPRRVNMFLGMVIEIVFAIVLVVIAWRLFEGMQSKLRYGETTFLLQFPIWWSYAASFVASVGAAVVGVYIAGVRSVEFATGRMIIAQTPEGEI